MTKDEIIEMARQAGLTSIDKKSPYLRDCLERFAKLVAAKERERMSLKATQNDWSKALIEAEREACANVARQISDKYAYGYYGNEVDTADEIEAAIRARGEA